MRLSVIIPVYNEEPTVRQILERALAVPVDKEVIVVDDCSTDGTHTILQEFETDGAIRLIRHEQNAGKGSAIRTGIKYVTGDVVIIQDADLEYDPADYAAVIRPIVDGRAEVSYGSRVLERSNNYSHLSFYIG